MAAPQPQYQWARSWLSAGGLILVMLLTPPARYAEELRAAPISIARSETRPVIREVRITGTVTSPRHASLSTQVGGMVARIAVEEGDRVEPGQVLLELDRELAALQLETVQAQAQRARAALTDARRRLKESRSLVRDGSFPQSEFESLQSEVQMAVAELDAAQAEARHQQALLERYQVTAPFAGVINQRLAELGEWISPGDSLLELVAMDGLRFDFRVPQERYPELEPETEVTIFLDALPEQTLAGRIQAIVPVSDPSARSFLLRVTPAAEDHPAITPGMSAQALLRIETGREGVVVPRDALLRYPDGRVSVWLLDDSGDRPRVRERRVRLGLSFGERVEIRQGLEPGVPVVVEGNEALQDGQAVSVVDET